MVNYMALSYLMFLGFLINFYKGQKNNNFNGHIYYLEYANTNLMEIK